MALPALPDNPITGLPDRTMLIVDDDKPFLARLTRQMEALGYYVSTAQSTQEAIDAIAIEPPAFAIIELRLRDGDGLAVLEHLIARRPEAHALILTGYANIATAVAAIKGGAIDYLAKPIEADEIDAALIGRSGGAAAPAELPMSADRVRWEHIQRIFELCGHNISETSRRLSMHRRTLQRILAKRPPR